MSGMWFGTQGVGGSNPLSPTNVFNGLPAEEHINGECVRAEKRKRRGLIADLHTIWRDIYAVIGLRQGLSTEALRFGATLKMKEGRRYLHLSPEFRERTVNRLESVLLADSSGTVTDTIPGAGQPKEREIETQSEWKARVLNSLVANDMVGTRRLELLTSTVSS